MTWSHMRPSSGTRASFLLRHRPPVTVGKSLKLPETVALPQKGTVISNPLIEREYLSIKLQVPRQHLPAGA